MKALIAVALAAAVITPAVISPAVADADLDLERRRAATDLDRNEPTADQVRTMALRAAGLRARRDLGWARRARLSALLPQITIAASRDAARDHKRSRASSGVERLDQNTADDYAYEARAVWHLDRLVFTSVELSAARAALSETRERGDLAARVTALYYRRRRAQLALLWDPPSNPLAHAERRLEIQELTAALDALTEGGFSASLRPSDMRTGFPPRRLEGE